MHAPPQPDPSPTTGASQAPSARMAPRSARAALRQRQRRLIDQYRDDPASAAVTDRARTRAVNQLEDGPLDPLHSWVAIGHDHAVTVPIALHEALGGLGDLPVPGDLLCAALAACTDSTLRVLANAMGVKLQTLEVDVDGHADVRGALCVSPTVPVGFGRLDLRVRLQAAPGTDPGSIDRLLAAAEHCCVVLRTLREGVPVEVQIDQLSQEGEPQ